LFQEKEDVMFRKKMIVRAFGLGLASAVMVLAQDGGQPGKTKSDNGEGAKSAADQREIHAADLHLTQNLQAAIRADKSLSPDARNVKISSQGGRVTLKGRVRSEEEAQKIVAKAIVLTSSDGNVDNQLSVKLVNTK
jgi:hyperosmotically inducible protein